MGIKRNVFLGWSMGALLPLAALAAAGDLRLVEAAQKGDKAALRVLLSQRADVNAKQPDGTTALHWAVQSDDLETADLLIRAGADVNASNELSVTALSIACSNGNAALVERLLQAGANPNAALATGETPLMTAARTGGVETVKLLLSRGAGVNARENRRGQTPLMWALAEKHPQVARVLIEHGADIHARSQGGFTPLLFAAQQGDLESARTLLAAGAKVNEATPDGMNALLMAAASGHEAPALFFLEQGADPNAADNNGMTAMHYAVLQGVALLEGIRLRKLVDHLFRPNMVELVKALLARGANPNARIGKAPRLAGARNLVITPAGATPFLLAATSFDISLMRLLTASGADPLIPTNDKTTALIAAAGIADALSLRDRTPEEKKTAFETVKLTVELGVDVNAANDTGLTAMHAAAYLGTNDIIQYLADRGAEVNVKDKFGQTPLSIAEKIIPPTLLDDNLRPFLVHQSTADLLRKLGAAPLATR